MESLEYISKGGKEIIMLWYWIPPFPSLLSAFLLSVSLMVDPFCFCFDLRLWTCSGRAYGIYGILQGKRESPLHILGDFLSLYLINVVCHTSNTCNVLLLSVF